jgi:sulfur transfer complex TusBCD TusB component (DsrH family)
LAGVYVAFEHCECCSHLRSRRASLLARLKVTVDDILARKLSLAMSAAIWA